MKTKVPAVFEPATWAKFHLLLIVACCYAASAKWIIDFSCLWHDVCTILKLVIDAITFVCTTYIYLHQGERKDAGKSPNLIFIYGVILHHIYIWQYFKQHNLQLHKVYKIHCFFNDILVKKYFKKMLLSLYRNELF